MKFKIWGTNSLDKQLKMVSARRGYLNNEGKGDFCSMNMDAGTCDVSAAPYCAFLL